MIMETEQSKGQGLQEKNLFLFNCITFLVVECTIQVN